MLPLRQKSKQIDLLIFLNIDLKGPFVNLGIGTSALELELELELILQTSLFPGK